MDLSHPKGHSEFNSTFPEASLCWLINNSGWVESDHEERNQSVRHKDSRTQEGIMKIEIEREKVVQVGEG